MFKNLIVATALMIASVSCSANNAESSSGNPAGEAKNQVPSKLTQMNDSKSCVKVLLKTSLGDIKVALFNETPKHRDNFVKLVNSGFYDGVLFHRVIKDFMVQTGDGTSKAATADTRLGAGDIGYTIEAEFVFPKFFHKRGALAAARTGDQVNPQRRSSGSQFYIVTGKVYTKEQMGQMHYSMQTAQINRYFEEFVRERENDIIKMQRQNDHAGLQQLQAELVKKAEDKYNEKPFKFTAEQMTAYTTEGGTPHLDGQYTVFGEVIEGMDVVDKIQNVATGAGDRPVQDVKIIKATIIK